MKLINTVQKDWTWKAPIEKQLSRDWNFFWLISIVSQVGLKCIVTDLSYSTMFGKSVGGGGPTEISSVGV